MKNRTSTFLTVIVCIALILGAVGIGTVKGYRDERQEILSACVENHADVRSLSASIAECERAAADFDHRLEHRLGGKIAGLFGVEPITDSMAGLHQQLLRDAAPAEPGLVQQLENLLDDHVDTSLSLGKILWTVVLLNLLFGKKARRKGVTLGKLLAGLGLFRLWRKD